jgi:acrylyl-CoA reductase (NADPH)
MSMFNAVVVEQQDGKQVAAVRGIEPDALSPGEVLVRVDYSTINYKDALAITGASPIIRDFPMVPGIDFAGVVEESSSDVWQAGDRVVLNGWGVGERHTGGLAQFARVKADWLLPLPERFSSRDAMVIGTAGYTSALCVDALVDYGVTPDQGEVLVTGASGGVGSFAVSLLHTAGFRVVASTGKTEAEEYLRDLGADEILDRNTLSAAGKPLQKERWAGVVDAAGGNTLVNACAQTRYGGAVAACGLADSLQFPASVAPFILRGIALLGVDSVMAPISKREAAWARLSRDLDPTVLSVVPTEIDMTEAIASAPDVLAGKIRGRLLVDVNR